MVYRHSLSKMREIHAIVTEIVSRYQLPLEAREKLIEELVSTIAELLRDRGDMVQQELGAVQAQLTKARRDIDGEFYQGTKSQD